MQNDVAAAYLGVDESRYLRGNVVELLAAKLAYQRDNDVRDVVDVEGHG